MQIIRALTVILLAVAGTIVPASAIQAAPAAGWCYGDYCSGLDPHTTRHVPDGNFCDADGRTVASASQWNSSPARTVELRWSDRCQVNWARVNFSDFSWVEARQVIDSAHCPYPYNHPYIYSQGYVSTNGVYWWSRMIFSPSKPVFADAMSGKPTWIQDLTTYCV